MPNKPRPENPNRGVRVDDELWGAAMAKAKREDRRLGDVIRDALRAYLDRPPTS